MGRSEKQTERKRRKEDRRKRDQERVTFDYSIALCWTFRVKRKAKELAFRTNQN